MASLPAHLTSNMQPTLVVHADWGSAPNKRWMARATLAGDGCYAAHAPEPVGEPGTLIRRLLADAGPSGCILLGFDFPIGLPARYASQVGVHYFLDLLPELGQGKWTDFYAVAERPDQISLSRPFYPLRSGLKGQTRLRHLLDGLGLESADDLRRQCERARPGRRAACPLFWTVGGQQVGKAAICGWKEVLGPALRSGADVAIWPFAGSLDKLYRPGRVVIAETYPAEFYTHLGMSLKRAAPVARPKDKVEAQSRLPLRSGKRVQRDRVANAPVLLAWAKQARVRLSSTLRTEIREGFGASGDGEDHFDAAVGLMGMLNVVLERRPPGDPGDERIRKIEGWILGQAAE
jgi:hypothetical protein